MLIQTDEPITRIYAPVFIYNKPMKTVRAGLSQELNPRFQTKFQTIWKSYSAVEKTYVVIS